MNTKTRTRLLGAMLAAVLLLTLAVPALATEPVASGPTVIQQENVSVIKGITAADMHEGFEKALSVQQEIYIWNSDQVQLELPSKTGYTVSWGFDGVASDKTPNAPMGSSQSVVVTEKLVTVMYLTVKLMPEAADSESLYAVYKLDPVSLTGVSVVPEPADTDLTKAVPYGTPLKLKASVELTDAQNKKVQAAPSESGEILGKKPTYLWSATEGGRPLSAPQPANQAVVAADTTSSEAVAHQRTYTCRVSVPSRAAGTETEVVREGSAGVAVSKPVLKLPEQYAGGISVEAGGDAMEIPLSWDGSVSPDAAFSGMTVTGLQDGPDGLIMKLGAPNKDGVLLTISTFNANNPYTSDWYAFKLDLAQKDNEQIVVSGICELKIRIMPKRAKVMQLTPEPAAVAAGQPVQLTATLADIQADTPYQWVQAVPAESPEWTPVSGEAASGTIKYTEGQTPEPLALEVQPVMDMLYNLRLGSGQDYTQAASPAKTYVFRLEAKDGENQVGAITGVVTPLEAVWAPTGSGTEGAPKAPAAPPEVKWTKSGALTPVPGNSMLANVMLPLDQTGPLLVKASYNVDDETAGAAEFTVEPVVLQTANGGTSYTYPRAVPVANPVEVGAKWSSTPASIPALRQIKVQWAVHAPDASELKGKTIDVAVGANGRIEPAELVPDVPGPYELEGFAYAYTGDKGATLSQVGGGKITVTFNAETVKPGSARITGNTSEVAVGDVVQLRAEIAGSNGVYQPVTSAADGEWKITLPDGKTETPTPSGGAISFTPKDPGIYQVTYTPKTGGEPATVQFTAVDPYAPAPQPEMTLSVQQDGKPAGGFVEPGARLTAVLEVSNLPATVAIVSGTLTAEGFGSASAQTPFVIQTGGGKGSAKLEYTVPADAQDGQILSLKVTAATAGQTGVTIPLPDEWRRQVSAPAGEFKVSLSGPAYGTIGQPLTITLLANQPVDYAKTTWTAGNYTPMASKGKATFTPTEAGSVTVGVVAVSVTGKAATAQMKIQVTPELKVSLLGPEKVDVGKAVTVTAVPSTSSADVVLTWNLSPTQAGMAVSGSTCKFTPAQTGQVKVEVKAVLGNLEAAAAQVITVENPEPGSSATPGASGSPGPDSSASPGASASPGPDSSASPGASASPGPDSSASPGASASPGPDTSASPGASASPGPDSSVSQAPSGSPSPTAPGTVPPGALLKLKPGSGLQLTVRGSSWYIEGIPIVKDAKNGVGFGELRDAFETTAGGTVRVVKADGSVNPSEGIVGTGTYVQLISNSEEVEKATVMIEGDVLGNGLLGINQLVRMAQVLNGTKDLAPVYEMAGAFGKSKINIADLVREAQMLNQKP